MTAIGSKSNVDPLPVLLYHAVVRDRAAMRSLATDDVPYAVTAETLRLHLSSLQAAGWRAMADVGEALSAEGKRLVITFDDSLPTHPFAAEVLSALGLKGLFLLTTGELGQPGRLALEAVDSLASASMRLGSHGFTHEFMTCMSDEQLGRELRESMEMLSRWPTAFRPALSLPGGRYDDRVLAAARRIGFRWILTSDEAIADADLRPVRFGRINVAEGMTARRLLDAVEGRRQLGDKIVSLAKRGARRLLGERAYLGLWRRGRCSSKGCNCPR